MSRLDVGLFKTLGISDLSGYFIEINKRLGDDFYRL